jgi:hypothetical protein
LLNRMVVVPKMLREETMWSPLFSRPAQVA